MADEPQKLLTGLSIPKPDGSIVRAGDDHFAIRAKRYTADCLGMAGEYPDRLAGRDIPLSNSTITRTRQDGFSIRAKRQASDVGAVATHLAQFARAPIIIKHRRGRDERGCVHDLAAVGADRHM